MHATGATTKRPFLLYKYRALRGHGLERVRRSIQDHEFYFDNPANFNDSFECLPEFRFEASDAEIVAYYASVLSRHHPNWPPYQTTIAALHHKATEKSRPGTVEYHAVMVQRYKESVIPKLPMFCLSATCQNILMWSHYAADHTGVCLEFDAQSNDIKGSREVVYSINRPSINMIKVGELLEMMEPMLLVKSLDWSYEQEHRLILIGRAAGLRKFRPQTLTGIVVGARTSEADREKVTSWALSRQPRLRVRQAVIARDTYSVDILETTGA